MSSRTPIDQLCRAVHDARVCVELLYEHTGAGTLTANVEDVAGEAMGELVCCVDSLSCLLTPAAARVWQRDLSRAVDAFDRDDYWTTLYVIRDMMTPSLEFIEIDTKRKPRKKTSFTWGELAADLRGNGILLEGGVR